MILAPGDNWRTDSASWTLDDGGGCRRVVALRTRPRGPWPHGEGPSSARPLGREGRLGEAGRSPGAAERALPAGQPALAGLRHTPGQLLAGRGAADRQESAPRKVLCLPSSSPRRRQLPGTTAPRVSSCPHDRCRLGPDRLHPRQQLCQGGAGPRSSAHCAHLISGRYLISA
jgi:hypothetical protein